MSDAPVAVLDRRSTPRASGGTGSAAPPTDDVGTSGAPATTRNERFGLIALAVAVGAVVVGTRWGDFTPDTRPDLYQDPGRFLAASVQAWVGGNNGLGQSNFNAGAAPVAAVVWVIRALGASPWLAVRIWRLLLLFVAGWGIRRYLGALYGPRLTVGARLVVTAFWVANPYVVVAGNTTPILLPYALLPWTMLPFLESTRHPRSWKWPAVFALAFFAQTGLNAGVVSFFQLLALPAHVLHARWVERRDWLPLIGSVVRCGFLSVLVSLYWLAPSFLATGTGTGIAEATENPVDVARTSSYAETARLLGHWPLYGRAGDRLFLGGYASYVDNPFVLVCSFLVLVAVGASLVWSRGRERLLSIGLIVAGIPVMVGLYPPDSPYPAGRFLGKVFDAVPAALAFRTTNKVGAVVVLGYAVALAAGVRAWSARAPRPPVRWAGIAVVGVVLVGASGPMWSGQLYPLGYRIPATWEQALADLDSRDADARVLVVPGGTGGNYRWGMRSPDDLFPSLLDRPVAVRNTVVGRGSPSGNFLAGYDGLLAEGSLPAGSLSTVARYLGAADVLVRNDLLTEEIGGATPAVVSAQVAADPGLSPLVEYGRPGTDTLPGRTGRGTAADREADPADAAVSPLATHTVIDQEPVVRLAPVDRQVLVDGDGEAFPALSWAGILDGTQPVVYLGELTPADLRRALDDGSRIVLTDTNRRRAWDINRVRNATSATLAASEDLDAGNGASVTLWPDEPAKQTVTEIVGAKEISATLPAFGLHPYGRPGQAFDGDPTSAWRTGALGTARGDELRLVLDEPQVVSAVRIQALASEPSRVSAVQVEVGDTTVVQQLPTEGDGAIDVLLAPTRSDRVTVTLLGQTEGTNPVGISEVTIEGVATAEVERLPTTLTDLLDAAEPEALDALAATPLDVVLTRARGTASDLSDDEERQLDRRFELPQDRTFDVQAELQATGADPTLVALLRGGTDDGSCREIARIDGDPLLARFTSTPDEIAEGLLKLESCAPLTLDAGSHRLAGIFGWRLDRMLLSSPGDGPAAGQDPAAGDPEPDRLDVTERSDTTLQAEVTPADGDRYLRLGQAFDPRWALAIDGRDAGPPILIDGYSAGWRIPAGARHLAVRFTPQSTVRSTFTASALSVVGVVAVAVLPVPTWLADRRRRGRRGGGEEPAAEPEVRP